MTKIILTLLLLTNTVYAQMYTDTDWEKQKYSMFIHWGLYSQLGGVWNGEPVRQGYSEQIQSHGGIFSDYYASVARQFTADKWNPDTIAQLAKKAGMKSIVFTSKHHDGFCMYDCQYTDYDIVEATPCRRDVMKELADACAREGIRFGVYFSLIDWHFPEAYPISSHNADPATPAHHAYNMKQVEEIMTRYGAISEIWFDMGAQTPQQSRELYALVKRLQPACMVSGRLGNDCGDFSVMADNECPDYKIDVPWQTAASFFNETWSYRSWQQRGDWKTKANEKIETLIKVVSRGGNYLLNIGPKGDGSVVDFERDVLLYIGKWLDKYGEAIYDTRANPFHHTFAWGDVTTRANTLYLFIRTDTLISEIQLNGIRGKLQQTVALGGTTVNAQSNNAGINICLTGKPLTDSPVEILRLDFETGYTIVEENNNIRDNRLTAHNATPTFAYSGMDYYSGFKSTVAYNWNFYSARQKINPVVYYTDREKGKTIQLTVDGTPETIRLDAGKPYLLKTDPRTLQWGDIYISAPRGGVFGRMRDAVQRNKIDEFQYGKRYEIPLGERQYIVLEQNIHSDKQQPILLEIGGGNGIQILLNGESLAISSFRAPYTSEKFILPLRKGNNHLIIRLYNRFEKTLCYSLDNTVKQTIYRQTVPSIATANQKTHTCTLSPAYPETIHTAMQLENILIEMK